MSLGERIGAPKASRKRRANYQDSLRGGEDYPLCKAIPSTSTATVSSTHSTEIEVEHQATLSDVSEQDSIAGSFAYMDNETNQLEDTPGVPYEEPIEFAMRPFPRRGGPPVLAVQGPIHQPNDKLLYYTMRMLASQKSRADVLLDEDQYTVLNNGTGQSITYTKDVKPFLKNMLEKYNLTRKWFCAKCHKEMLSKSSRCQNRRCSLYNKKVKRTSTRRRLELIVANVKDQLEIIMHHFIDRIVEVHGVLHNAQVAPGNIEESDIRRLPRYMSHIESVQDYQQKNLNVLLCIATDGFRPKRLSKSEFWPIYLRVDALDRCDRDSYFNSVLSSILFSRKNPSIPITEAMLARLVEEVNYINNNPLPVLDSQNVLWNVKFKIYSGVMDFAALKSFYKIPRWSSAFGCGKCIHPGNRMGRRMSWATLNRRFIRRTNASILRDAAAAVNGLTEVTPAMEVISPHLYPGDALHVVCEGLVPKLLDFLFDKGPFAELNLSPAEIVVIKEAISNVVNSTYSTYVLSIEDRSNMTGSELQKLADVAFVLSAVHCPSLRTPAKSVASACLIGFWWLFRSLQRFQSIRGVDIAVIKQIAEDVQFLFEELHPELATMKFHYFFEHAVKEELDEAGSIFAWTAAVFEAWHRLFQLKENQSTTNCFYDMVKRYILRKEVYGKFAKAAIQSRDPLYLKLLDIVENEHQKRFPKMVDINNDMYIPTASSVSAASINRPEWQFFIQQYGMQTLSSRLIIKGNVYSSEVLWKRTVNSQQSYVYIEYFNAQRVLIRTFGSVLLFASDGLLGSSCVLLKVFHCHCPFLTILNCVRRSNQPNWRTAERLINHVSINNHFFMQSGGQSLIALDASAIKGRANLVEVGGVSYFSRVD